MNVPGPVTTLAFSPDGTELLAAMLNGSLRLVNVADGGVVVLRGHHGAIDDAAFSPSGDEIVSGGADGTVRVWELRRGRHTPSRSRAGWGSSPPSDSRGTARGSRPSAPRGQRPELRVLRPHRRRPRARPRPHHALPHAGRALALPAPALTTAELTRVRLFDSPCYSLASGARTSDPSWSSAESQVSGGLRLRPQEFQALARHCANL